MQGDGPKAHGGKEAGAGRCHRGDIQTGGDIVVLQPGTS